MSENVNNLPGEGVKPISLLEDGPKQNDDLRLLAKAVRKRWAIPPASMQVAIARLTEIAEKRTVEVMCGEGVVAVEGAADTNAIRAAAVLAQMESQNQADDHLADKNSRIDAGKPTELGGVVFSTPLTEGVYEEQRALPAVPKQLEGGKE
jgi:hypothetical protein